MNDMKVVIIRKWDDKDIKTIVTNESTTIQLDIVAFIVALQREVQLPPLKFQSKKAKMEKEEALKVSVEDAVKRVLEKMKAGASRSTR